MNDGVPLSSGPQPIVPNDGARYSDIFWASLYGTLCQFGFNETRLIWSRSSAMLVAHSFIFNVVLGQLLFSADREKRVAAVGLAVVGIALTSCWWILNFHGWRNQDTLYRLTSNLRFSGVTVPLPTDFWLTFDRSPAGTIYWAAQVIVFIFFSAYLAMVWHAMSHFTGRWISSSIVVLATFLAATIVGICCRSLKRGRLAREFR